jgi:hypothetical protein
VYRLGDVENSKDLEQHRNDNGAATYAEQSRENAGDDAGADYGSREPGELTG